MNVEDCGGIWRRVGEGLDTIHIIAYLFIPIPYYHTNTTTLEQA